MGVGWYFFGAQAALIYGVQRLTVDVTVHLGEMPTRDLVAALKNAGFRLRVDDPDFIERTRVVPIVHEQSAVAVDVVLRGLALKSCSCSAPNVSTSMAFPFVLLAQQTSSP